MLWKDDLAGKGFRFVIPEQAEDFTPKLKMRRRRLVILTMCLLISRFVSVKRAVHSQPLTVYLDLDRLATAYFSPAAARAAVKLAQMDMYLGGCGAVSRLR